MGGIAPFMQDPQPYLHTSLSEQDDIRMQLEKLISMLVALNAQIGGANGKV